MSCPAAAARLVADLKGGGSGGWEYQNWEIIRWNLEKFRSHVMAKGTEEQVDKAIAEKRGELNRTVWKDDAHYPRILAADDNWANGVPHVKPYQWEQIGQLAIDPSRIENSVGVALLKTRLPDGSFEARLVSGEFWSFDSGKGQMKFIPLRPVAPRSQGTGPAVVEGEPRFISMAQEFPPEFFVHKEGALNSELKSRTRQSEISDHYFSPRAKQYLEKHRANFLGALPVGEKQFYNPDHQKRVVQELEEKLTGFTATYGPKDFWRPAAKTDLAPGKILYGWFQTPGRSEYKMRLIQVEKIEVDGQPPDIVVKAIGKDPYNNQPTEIYLPNADTSHFAVLHGGTP